MRPNSGLHTNNKHRPASACQLFCCCFLNHPPTLNPKPCILKPCTLSDNTRGVPTTAGDDIIANNAALMSEACCAAAAAATIEVGSAMAIAAMASRCCYARRAASAPCVARL